MRKSILVAVITVFIVTVLIASDGKVPSLSDYYGYTKAVLSYYGSSGREVTNIQTKLKNWGYYNGDIDGSYGYQTYSAVKSFQSKNGLSVDGVAGSETLAALGLPSDGAASVGSGATPTSNDQNLLAHLVYGEARGEPYTGQVAVAAVVINRTRDDRFPKTIAGVIYQPGAFDAVDDGQINLDPDGTAYRAARDALNGWDPTYGCVYYYNPATATSKWIWSRPILLKIGDHNFAK